MKKIMMMALLGLVSSSAFAAGPSVITCKNEGFSELTIILKPYDHNQMGLEVTAAPAQRDAYMPAVGERSLMIPDSDVKDAGVIALASNANEEQRVFQVSIRKADLASTPFKATIQISKEESDLTFAAYEMTCTR